MIDASSPYSAGDCHSSGPQRVLLAKVGLDGHDRGIKVIARGLRDAGFHVIYGGLWQTPEAVAQAVLDEDVDWLGLSMLSGAHLTQVPRVLQALADLNARARCVVGGIIPPQDELQLRQLGVDHIFRPGTLTQDVVEHLSAPDAREGASDLSQLFKRCAHGDRSALSALLTLCAQDRLRSEDIPLRSGRLPYTVAFTGSAGVGKSSLMSAICQHLIDRYRVAVLACDPESPFTGGALLGDRIRISNRNAEPNLLVRSLAVPSGSQAVAENLQAMVRVLGMAQFDVVMVETVGAGQGDVAIRSLADSVLLLLQPNSGDTVQWDKAGILEIADVIVAQKSDLTGALRLHAELQEAVSLREQHQVPIVATSASNGEGISTLCDWLDGRLACEEAAKMTTNPSGQ